MFRIDIGDHRDLVREFQERSIGLVGFKDEPVAPAQPRDGGTGVACTCCIMVSIGVRP